MKGKVGGGGGWEVSIILFMHEAEIKDGKGSVVLVIEIEPNIFK